MQEKIQNSRQKLEHIHENLGQMQAHLAAGQKTQAQLRREINAINQQVVVVHSRPNWLSKKAFSPSSYVPPTRWVVSRRWPSGCKRNVRENWGV